MNNAVKALSFSATKKATRALLIDAFEPGSMQVAIAHVQ